MAGSGAARRAACRLLCLISLLALFDGCASKGVPLPAECPADWLTLPVHSTMNKLHADMQPPDPNRDSTRQRSSFREKNDFSVFFAAGFDCPDGPEAVRQHFIRRLKIRGFREENRKEFLDAFRAGQPTGVGRRTLLVSEDDLTGICVQRVMEYAAEAEHPTGEFLLTFMEYKKKESSLPATKSKHF